MKIQFDANQAYQLDAVQAVVDVFAGQPERSGGFDLSIDTGSAGLWTELGTGNSFALDDEALLANVRAVQQRSDIARSDALQGRHFTVEMETGTGKTYVYLRTIYELNARYGFSKFIVVVPTVAIREGVLKNLEITREHFSALYGKPSCDWWVYDSKQVSRVRQFAGTSALQILVINIDSFNKPSNNVIHAEMDRLGGRKPLDFIRATQPIVIVDEPQNMESEQAQSAITSLNPLCTLRYSATHKNVYNLVYRLDPIRAYDLKLVKRIEVDSVLDDPDFNKPFIRVETVAATRTQISAKLVIDVQQARAIRRKRITVSQNSRGIWKRRDLLGASGGRPAYAGYTVEGIDVAGQTVTFSNGVTLAAGQEQGARSEALMRIQIRETVLKHLSKELEINRRPAGDRLKVLSLFFIDRVANYADAPSSENPRAGILKRFFAEEYSTLAATEAFLPLALPPADRVQSAYFARTKEGAARDNEGGHGGR